MTMRVIYTITVFNVLHQRPELTPRDQRCWCWCPTEQEARDCLQGDGVDLYFESGTYQLAVIEEVPPFLMGGGVEGRKWWFEATYDRTAQSYVIRELGQPPAFATDIAGCFSIG